MSDLMVAGHAAVQRLQGKYIRTIGDLAQQPQSVLHNLLGKQGDLLWQYANGMDDAPVRLYGDVPEIKSIRRGRTFRRDLVTVAEVKTGLSVLVDEVTRSLRRHGLKAEVVSIQIRRPDMSVVSRQTTLGHYTCLQHEIRSAAFALVRENWFIGEASPIRALTVGVTKLLPADEVAEQISLLDIGTGNGEKRQRRERLEAAVEEIRQKHGDEVITLGYREDESIGVRRKESEE